MINRRFFLGMLAVLPAGVKARLGLKSPVYTTLSSANSQYPNGITVQVLRSFDPVKSAYVSRMDCLIGYGRVDQRAYNSILSICAETIQLRPRMSWVNFRANPVDRKRSLGRRRYLKRYRRVRND